MKSKLNSLVIIALLFVSLAIVFVACGGGDMVDLSAITQDVNGANTNLEDEIKDPNSPIWTQPDLPSSSSDVQPPPSSGVQPPPSSGVQPPVSSATPPPPKSSSSVTPAPSGSCTKNNELAGFTCKWNKEGFVMPGMEIEPQGTPPEGCTVKWNYKSGAFAGCNVLTGTSLKADGDSRYLLFAELSCADGPHINACTPTDGLPSKATPILVGTCKWDRPTNTDPIETTLAKGAVPSGIELIDTNSVCTGNPKIVYKYDNFTKDWPMSGSLPEAKIYTDVQATVACSGTGYTYDVTPADPCPPLKANAGSLVSVSIPNFNDQTTTAQKQFKIPSDECADIEVTWTSNWNDHPIAVFCTVNFVHEETGGVATAGKLELQYNGKIKSATGGYNVTLQNEGFNLQPAPTSTGAKYEFNGVCATAYVNGVKLPNKSIDCEITTNAQK